MEPIGIALFVIGTVLTLIATTVIFLFINEKKHNNDNKEKSSNHDISNMAKQNLIDSFCINHLNKNYTYNVELILDKPECKDNYIFRVYARLPYDPQLSNKDKVFKIDCNKYTNDFKTIEIMPEIGGNNTFYSIAFDVQISRNNQQEYLIKPITCNHLNLISKSDNKKYIAVPNNVCVKIKENGIVSTLENENSFIEFHNKDTETPIPPKKIQTGCDINLRNLENSISYY